jgi:hypothetical protein
LHKLDKAAGTGSKLDTDDENEANDGQLCKDVSAVDTYGGKPMKTFTNKQDHVLPIKPFFHFLFVLLVVNVILSCNKSEV